MLLTTKDVCEQLAVSRSTVDRIVALGELTCYRVGKQRRYYQKDVDAYLEKCRIRTSPAFAAELPEQPRPVPGPAPRKRGRPRKGGTPVVYYPGMKVV